MGCNCKNTSEKARKYSDDGKPVLKHLGWIGSVFVIITRVIITILTFGVIIIIIPFFLLYMAFCMVTGKGININLNRFFRKDGR